MLILQERHERRGVGGSTESMGFMASHMSMATKLAARLASGEATEKDRAEAAKLAGCYSKQLARVFRERELAARPDLLAQAAVFGIGRGGGTPSRAMPVSAVRRRSCADHGAMPNRPSGRSSA